MIIADIPFDIGATNQFILGACGVLMVVTLVFGVVLQAKKLFGRQPPIDDVLKGLRKEIYHAKGSVRKELLAEMHLDRIRLVKLEEHYEEMQLDRERKWKELNETYHALDLKIAAMTGLTPRIDALLKKLETKT